MVPLIKFLLLVKKWEKSENTAYSPWQHWHFVEVRGNESFISDTNKNQINNSEDYTEKFNYCLKLITVKEGKKKKQPTKQKNNNLRANRGLQNSREFASVPQVMKASPRSTPAPQHICSLSCAYYRPPPNCPQKNSTFPSPSPHMTRKPCISAF